MNLYRATSERHSFYIVAETLQEAKQILWEQKQYKASWFAWLLEGTILLK